MSSDSGFNCTLSIRGLCCFLTMAPVGTLWSAEPVDETKLPPLASVKIDFARDIKPILDTSCLRCHGLEKPKGKFRLDSREAALKGGDTGVVVISGQSAKSPFIHFVAGLVEDMEMPPSGKGEPLSPQQIGLLRAWIDQGVVWNVAAPTNQYALEATPMFGGTMVSGSQQRFRHHYGQREGFNGGLEKFELSQTVGADTKVSFFGHAWRDDYELVFTVTKKDLGFIRSGWQEYRRYYDDTGGYFLAAPPMSTPLETGSHVSRGKAWIDLGLTLPDWPQMGLSYEYDYKQGQQSTLISGPFAPGQRAIDEGVHIIKFNLDAEYQGITFEERFRGEFYSLNTQGTNFVASIARNGPPSSNVTTERTSEGHQYFQGVNTLRIEKKFNRWLFSSAGYLYSKLNSDVSYSLDTMPLVGDVSNNREWRFPRITLEKEAHVFNLNGVLGPFDQLTIATGVQSEWSRQRSFGQGNLNQIAPTLDNPASLGSDYDLVSVEEYLALRYAKIPFTALFGDVRLQQQTIGHSAELAAPVSVDRSVFMQRTDFTSQLGDGRVGFNSSPWPWVSWSAHYRRHQEENDYDNAPLVQPKGLETAYPAFIRARDIITDEIQTKIVLRPRSWLKTTLTYQLVTTDYSTDTGPFTQRGILPFVPGNITPGGNILSGQVDSDIYSLNATAALSRRLNLASTFSYQPTSVETSNNGQIAPFQGEIYSVLAHGSYVLSRAATLFASYAFSEASYGSSTLAGGLPVGNQYQQHAVQVGLERRLKKGVTTRLHYGYYYYNEYSNGGANNYVAHSIFSTVNFKLP